MILSVCVLWSMADAAAVLTLRTGSHNGVPPFPRTNGRQIASNSKGIWFLAHDGAVAGVPAIHLTVSKAAETEISGDSHRSVEVAGGSGQSVLTGPSRGARAASLVIDRDDVLHLVFQSSEPEGIWYAQCPVADEKPSKSLGTRTNWTRSDGRTPGPERIDRGDGPQLGDLVADNEGRPWVLYSQVVQSSSRNVYAIQDKGQHYSRRARQPARQLWAASPTEEEPLPSGESLRFPRAPHQETLILPADHRHDGGRPGVSSYGRDCGDLPPWFPESLPVTSRSDNAQEASSSLQGRQLQRGGEFAGV